LNEIDKMSNSDDSTTPYHHDSTITQSLRSNPNNNNNNNESNQDNSVENNNNNYNNNNINNDDQDDNSETESQISYQGPYKEGAGILIRTLKPGNKTYKPDYGSIVKVHYEGYLTTVTSNSIIKHSKPFDSSRRRKQPLCFNLGDGQVIQGWDVAVSAMCLGQIIEVTIPYLYGYGANGYPPIIPPKTTLIFEIELMDFTYYE